MRCGKPDASIAEPRATIAPEGSAQTPGAGSGCARALVRARAQPFGSHFFVTSASSATGTPVTRPRSSTISCSSCDNGGATAASRMIERAAMTELRLLLDRLTAKIWPARLLSMYVIAQNAFHKWRTITDELPSLPAAC